MQKMKGSLDAAAEVFPEAFQYGENANYLAGVRYICITPSWTSEELSILKGLAQGIGGSLAAQKAIKGEDVRTQVVTGYRDLYKEVKELLGNQMSREAVMAQIRAKAKQTASCFAGFCGSRLSGNRLSFARYDATAAQETRRVETESQRRARGEGEN